MQPQPIKINNADIRGGSPLEAYRNLLAGKRIEQDGEQEKVAFALDGLARDLTGYSLKPSLLGFIKGKKKLVGNGFYIFGKVGRGKSMLMDLFFTTTPVKSKRRVHFHAFMLDIHRRIHILRQKGEGDPIPPIIEEIFREGWLLCFDEFQVNDIADAMILKRLFEGFFAKGMIIVATSNVAPEDLYKDGLQRSHFLPFIDLLAERVKILNLNSAYDYRLQKLKSLSNLYFSPLGAESDYFIENIFKSLSLDQTPKTINLAVAGRNLEVSRAAGDVAFFTFDELCAKPLGAADYIEISRNFGTVLLKDVPQLSAENRNEAKRFVTLIDELYEHKVKLIVTAAAKPEDLYKKGDGSFEFQRTVSRLFEMQSESYLESRHIA